MRIITIALASAALAGCVNAGMPTMRAEGPAATFTSSKPEDELSRCILFAWQETNMAGWRPQTFIQPGQTGGTTVYTTDNEYFADIKRVGESTTVKYYEVNDTWVSRKLQPKLRGCL